MGTDWLAVLGDLSWRPSTFRKVPRWSLPCHWTEVCLTGASGACTYQPPLERDGVHAEVPDQAEVVVHVLQAAQHLQAQEQGMTNSAWLTGPPPSQRCPRGRWAAFRAGLQRMNLPSRGP